MPPRTPKNQPKTADTDEAGINAGSGAAIKTRVILKKKDFVDRATDRSGLRKADAKAAIDATLAVLTEALAQGEELILPPLGKLKVAREKDHPRGKILMLRLQLIPGGPSEFDGGTEPLAETGD